MRKLFLTLIKIYQSFFTHLKINSCRYYPTCSTYARQEFEHDNIILAFFKSLLRILRCNQLFVGGIDYPVVYKQFSLSSTKNKKISIKYWFVEKSPNRYYLIESFKEKNE